MQLNKLYSFYSMSNTFILLFPDNHIFLLVSNNDSFNLLFI